MAKYFVSRHKGAVEWARRRGIEAEIVSHLDVERIEAGDVVYGTLPISRIAEINARGARYLHLDISLPAEMRGKDLDADDMERIGAKLVEYCAKKVGAKKVGAKKVGAKKVGAKKVGAEKVGAKHVEGL